MCISVTAAKAVLCRSLGSGDHWLASCGSDKDAPRASVVIGYELLRVLESVLPTVLIVSSWQF
jgi:hypothetical protein